MKVIAKSAPVFVVKLQIQNGKANPAPPVGTALGPRGINIMEFCKAFNEKTKDLGSDIVTAVISIYKDKSFSFIIKSSPVSMMIKKALSITSGSKEPGLSLIGTITKSQVLDIATKKMADTNAANIDSVVSMVSGTATSMGIEVVDE